MLSKRFALRLAQLEHLYTRFGNECPLSVCNNNNNQNSSRLRSGVVGGLRLQMTVRFDLGLSFAMRTAGR